MNDFFNIKRFGAYAARDYRTHWKKYALMAGGLLGLMMLEFTVLKAINRTSFSVESIQNMVGLNFGLVMSVAVVFFTISVMKPMKSRHTLAVENTVPASLFERYLFTLLNTTVVFFAVFFLIYLVMACFGMAVFGVGTIDDYFYNRERTISRLFLWLCLPMQAAAMYAGTMERRRHMTSLLLVGITVIAGAAIFAGTAPLISERFDTAIRFGPMFFKNIDIIHTADSDVIYGLPGITGIRMDGPEISTFLAVVEIAMFWVAAWFNFRERSAK